VGFANVRQPGRHGNPGSSGAAAGGTGDWPGDAGAVVLAGGPKGGGKTIGGNNGGVVVVIGGGGVVVGVGVTVTVFGGCCTRLRGTQV
jgi:hypothetical protein